MINGKKKHLEPFKFVSKIDLGSFKNLIYKMC